MFIDADDKLIVKRMLIMLGLILVPVGIMFLAGLVGLNDYPIYEKIIGALLIIAGIAVVTVMIKHTKQTMDGMPIMGEFILMSLIYLAFGFLLCVGAINI